MNTEHPKALDARLRATQRRNVRATEREELARYGREGIHFLRIGNTTVAYRIHVKDILHVANTIRHPGDKDDPHQAKLYAGRRLKDRQFVTLRRPKTLGYPFNPNKTARSPMPIKNFLTSVFGNQSPF